MLRPGRLDKLVHVGLPSADQRVSILQKQTRKTPLTDDVDLKAIAHHPLADGFSGADCAALVREATLCALREYKQKLLSSNSLQNRHSNNGVISDAAKMHSDAKINLTALAMQTPTSLSSVKVCPSHFERAFQLVRPSVSRLERKVYEKIRNSLRRE